MSTISARNKGVRDEKESIPVFPNPNTGRSAKHWPKMPAGKGLPRTADRIDLISEGITTLWIVSIVPLIIADRIDLI